VSDSSQPGTQTQPPDPSATVPPDGDAQRLAALLEEWVLLREQGKEISVIELCRDCPHLAAALAEEVALFKRFEAAGPARAGRPVPPAEEFAGLRYQPLRHHAQGGLGVVFVARDTEVGREVALKRIQERRQHFPDDRARFVAEAEITGRLEHPGVVPVYGLGHDASGQPYYAMRLIQGRTLADAIDAFHGRGPGPVSAAERNRGLRALLTRFIAVCNTVGYAHSKGVIHRDLKPSNVLLGDYGETLVIDWGLARQADALEGAGEPCGMGGHPAGGSRTQTGSVLGTCGFMSPEQSRGDRALVGPASDVFSLGATLYALLTGRAAYAGTRALDDARAGRFARPRQVSRAVPPALEAVCLRAMAARPEDRYAGALDLAADVQRWLDDEPVRAYREPLRLRLGRWARRHRTAVTVAVMLLAAGVVGLALGLWAVGREQARTAEALDQAEANLKLARQAIDECFNVAKAHPLFQKPRMDQAKKLLLEKTLPFYRQFRAQRPEDPALQHQEAEQWFRVGYIEQILGRSAEARHAYAQARDLMAKLLKAHPGEPKYQHNLALVHIDLGYLLEDLGKHAEALHEYDRAGDLQAELLKAQPDVPAHRHYLAMTHANRGNVYLTMGRRAEALRDYQRAHDLQVELSERRPGVPGYQHALALTHHNRGWALTELGKYAQALKEYQRAAELQERLVKEHPDEPSYQHALGRTHTNRALLLTNLGKGEEAVSASQQAARLQAKLVEDHPDVPSYRHDLARTRTNGGLLLAGLGRGEEALRAYEQAHALQAKLAAAHPDRPGYRNALALTHHNRAVLLADQGKLEEALKDYQRAAELQDRLVNTHPDVPEYRQDLARTYLSRGVVLAGLGRVEEALQAYEQAHGMQSRVGATHAGVPEYVDILARIHLNRGAALARKARYADSLADLDRGIALVEKLGRLDPRSPRAAAILPSGLHWRAKVLTRVARLHDADADWDRLLALVPAARQAPVRQHRTVIHAIGLALAGDHRGAAAAVEDVARTPSLPGPVIYNLACVFAQAASAASRDPAATPAQRAEVAAGYARRAFALLERARRDDYFRVPYRRAHLDRDEDLAFLRGRDEYRAFVRSLTSKK
jgi:serine/threonine-protein kinase